MCMAAPKMRIVHAVLRTSTLCYKGFVFYCCPKEIPSGSFYQTRCRDRPCVVLIPESGTVSDAGPSDREVNDSDEENLPTRVLTTELPSDNETEGRTPACPLLSTSRKKQKSPPQVFDWGEEDRCFLEPAEPMFTASDGVKCRLKYFQVFIDDKLLTIVDETNLYSFHQAIAYR
ncbi:uncharacterized protein LOC121835935 [Ixodes scapularis]|uniref:uncharacterized protein LOC121835935 n=1 Tax=Ixodes scapularis TaxID=6945 RepID=UPI001C390927|nr:uncharacterized protein LOC121835935 [Ixodes scapularis]